MPTEPGSRGPIVVTGATGALGQVLVRTLASHGERVVAVGRPQSRNALAELSEVAGVVPLELENSSADAWRPLVQRLLDEFGALGGAVLVAGGYRGGQRSFGEGAIETFRMMVEQNAETANTALSALLPPMVAARHGSIVLVGSRAAVRPWESAGAAAYAASKAAVVALAQALATEVLEHAVRINVVLPSTLDTAQNRSALRSAKPASWVEPESLSEVVAFLLSESSRDITGAAIPVFGRVRG